MKLKIQKQIFNGKEKFISNIWTLKYEKNICKSADLSFVRDLLR